MPTGAPSSSPSQRALVRAEQPDDQCPPAELPYVPHRPMRGSSLAEIIAERERLKQDILPRTKPVLSPDQSRWVWQDYYERILPRAEAYRKEGDVEHALVAIQLAHTSNNLKTVQERMIQWLEDRPMEQAILTNGKDPREARARLEAVLSNGPRELVSEYLKLGRRLNAQFQRGKSLVHLAVANADAPLLEALLEAGAPRYALDHDGLTPLMAAAPGSERWSQQSSDLTLKLLRVRARGPAGAPPAAPGAIVARRSDPRWPQVVEWGGDLAAGAVQGVLQAIRGPQVARWVGGAVPAAVMTGAIAVIETAKRAVPLAGNPTALRALGRAGRSGDGPSSAPSASGAPERDERTGINRQFPDGASVLHRWAAEGWHGEVIRALVAAGAAVDLRDAKGRTALHHASTPEAIEALLESGAELEARDHRGQTPAHLRATVFNREDNPPAGETDGRREACLKALFGAGANPMARDRDGRTALGAVVLNVRIKNVWYLNTEDARWRVKLLLEAGANASEPLKLLEDRIASAGHRVSREFTDMLYMLEASVVREEPARTSAKLPRCFEALRLAVGNQDAQCAALIANLSAEDIDRDALRFDKMAFEDILQEDPWLADSLEKLLRSMLDSAGSRDDDALRQLGQKLLRLHPDQFKHRIKAEPSEQKKLDSLFQVARAVARWLSEPALVQRLRG